MVTQHKKRLFAATGAVLAVWMPATVVLAQAAAPRPAATRPAAAAEKAPDPKLVGLWENLIHYLRIGQGDAARSFGQALVDSGAKPSEIYSLSLHSPGSMTALVRGRGLTGMKAIIDKLLGTIEQGYRTQRSDPGQIKEAIELLGGTQRAYLRGRDRLEVSGEYAVAQLLRKLEDPQITNVLREKIMVVLPRLGKGAVLPLLAAADKAGPHLMQVIANALGQIEYPHAVPGLMELYHRKKLQPQTRRILHGALVSCAAGDVKVLTKPLAELYYDLALKFYYRAESLLPDARSQTANVWYWDEDLAGLTYKAAPREIFCDLYAMRMARLALKHDPKFHRAVSLWLAANLKRQVDLPAGATDPTRAADEPPAQFYVLAAGAAYQQHVLARTLHDKDWATTVLAIESLGATAGAESLVEPSAGGAQPLVEALRSPNRLVRYWAALSLARALPRKRFAGDELVMPVLANALGQKGRKGALVVAANEQRRNALKEAVRTLGYEVVDGADAAKGLAAAGAAGEVDVAILDNDPDPMVGVSRIRRDPVLATLPIVIATQAARFQMLAKSDSRVRLVSPKAVGDALGEAIRGVVEANAGAPLTPEQATKWAVAAAEALRQLGLTGTAVFDITRCRRTLIAALADPRPEVQAAAAGALATMPDRKAQQAVAGLALNSATEEKVRLAGFTSLAESIRRFGNLLADPQAQAVVDLVGKMDTGPIGTAAARTLGALSLPSEKVKDLILQSKGPK